MRIVIFSAVAVILLSGCFESSKIHDFEVELSQVQFETLERLKPISIVNTNDHPNCKTHYGALHVFAKGSSASDRSSYWSCARVISQCPDMEVEIVEGNAIVSNVDGNKHDYSRDQVANCVQQTLDQLGSFDPSNGKRTSPMFQMDELRERNKDSWSSGK